MEAPSVTLTAAQAIALDILLIRRRLAVLHHSLDTVTSRPVKLQLRGQVEEAQVALVAALQRRRTQATQEARP